MRNPLNFNLPHHSLLFFQSYASLPSHTHLLSSQSAYRSYHILISTPIHSWSVLPPSSLISRDLINAKLYPFHPLLLRPHSLLNPMCHYPLNLWYAHILPTTHRLYCYSPVSHIFPLILKR